MSAIHKPTEKTPISITIKEMSLEDYRKNFGAEYDEGNLWDYPLNEFDELTESIRENGGCQEFALIRVNNEWRIFELTAK